MPKIYNLEVARRDSYSPNFENLLGKTYFLTQLHLHVFYVACKKPQPWCAGDGIYQMMDCDGDKIEDPTCSYQDGNFYVVSSKNGCKVLGPNAVCKVKSRGEYCECVSIR